MIIVGTTIAPWKCNGEGELLWLRHAPEMVVDAAALGIDLHFLAVLEVDARGLTPYAALRNQLSKLESTTWTFSFDDGAEIITTHNRLVRICTGRNFIHEFAMRTMASHILFLDSDTEVPGDSISKLLELDHPVVGGDVPTYCLSGPPVAGFDFPVQEHWNTAGFLLVQRQVFSKLRWRWSLEDGLTDDPAFQGDQLVWGFGPTWVRKDVVGGHESPLYPVEYRDPDARKVHR